MIDLHTHTFFSDGVLIPSELVRRAESIGVTAIALTDHIDTSNYTFIADRLVSFAETMTDRNIKVLAGGEITHTPPDQIGSLVVSCREAGMKIVLVHGETIVEPVAPGTNRAAIEAGVDILAHPGLISDDDTAFAKERGVALEISGRSGHSFTNGHVAAMARKHGATLVFNSDTHQPRDMMDEEMATRVARGCGMTNDEIVKMFNASKELVNKALLST